MFKRIISFIPNTITCMSMLCGVLAIVASFRYNDMTLGMPGYKCAFILIAIAAVFDFCDGLAARLLHAYSNMGKELDSLSDLVSFGVAPGMLMFNMLTVTFGLTSPWLPYLAFLIPLCGELRLAKFNVDDTQTTSFRGMPIPANAIFWIGLCSMHETGYYIDKWLIAILIVSISILMVTFRFKMFSLKFKNLSVSQNIFRYILIAASTAMILLSGLAELAWTIIIYIVLSLASNMASGR